MREFAFFQGPNPGPTTVILGGVHGHEIMALQAVREVADELHSELGYEGIHAGRVLFLEAHQEAVRLGVRFVDQNLNRQFTKEALAGELDPKVREQKIARSLVRHFNRADYLLDLHTSDEATPPFLICQYTGIMAGLIKAILPDEARYVLSGLDGRHPGSTDGYMYHKGKIGVCLECGSNKDSNSTKVGKTAIYRALHHLGHIRDPKVETNTTRKPILLEASFIHKTEHYFDPRVSRDEFTWVTEGTFMGWDGDQEVIAPSDGYVIWVDLCNSAGEEAFVLAREI